MKHVWILLRHDRNNGAIIGVEAVTDDETMAHTLLFDHIKLHKGHVLFSLEYKAVS